MKKGIEEKHTYIEPNSICELCGNDMDVLKNYKLQEKKLTDTNIKSCIETARVSEKLKQYEFREVEFTKSHQKLNNDLAICKANSEMILAEKIKLMDDYRELGDAYVKKEAQRQKLKEVFEEILIEMPFEEVVYERRLWRKRAGLTNEG